MSEDWVVDSLVGFLQSPVWSSPVNNFIDENCAVFDSGEENEFAYTEVHNNYGAMVDNLLSKFTFELKITAEQLVQACEESGRLGPVYQKQLEQVLAAGNFVLFKSLMVQRNIELEMQALRLIKNQIGHAPDAYDPNSKWPTAPPVKDQYIDDDDLSQQALEVSKREFETQKSLDEEEMQKLIDLATQESLRLYEASEREKKLKAENTNISSSTSEEPDPPKIQKAAEPEKEQSDKVSSPLKSSQQAPLVSLSPDHTASNSTSEAASVWLQSAKQEYQLSDGSQTQQKKMAVQVPTDLKSREAYLKRQRDHLLKLKQQARAKELDAYKSLQTSNPKKPSPSVSRSQSTPNPLPTVTTKPPDKAVAATNLTSNKKATHTGVLCSVIASKLKEQS